MSPLPLGLYQTSRKSPFLFQWEARDLSLTARTGQLGTLTRASDSGIASFLDSNGSVGLAARNAPRWHRDPTSGLFGLLLEGARPNIMLRSSEWDNAAWVNGGASATPNTTSAPDGTLTADTIARVVSGGDSRYQAPTFTGDGTKAVSVFVKQGTSAVVRFAVYDSTAAVYRRQIDLTWTAGVPVLTSASGMGTIFPVIALGNGWYRIAFAADAVIAANVNFAPLVYPSQGGANGDTIILWGAQVEDATFPSSYIPTAAATVTRAADALSFPFNAVPHAMTVYADMIDGGNNSAAGPLVFSVGGTVDAALFTVGAQPRYALFHQRAGPVTSQSGVATVLGDHVELRAILAGDGSVALGQAVNGAAEIVAPTSGVNALASTWAAATLTIGALSGGAQSGFSVFRSLRIASGVQSMDFMRSA